MLGAALGLVCLLPGLAWAQVTDRERELYQQALAAANLGPNDLIWDRRPFTDAWRMPLIDRALDRPFETGDALMSLQRTTATNSPSQILALLAATAYGETWRPRSVEDALIEDAQLPAEVRRPVSAIARAIAQATLQVRKATEKLTEADARLVIESLPQLAVEEESLRFDFVRQPSATLTEVLGLLEQVDLAAIRAAAAQLSSAIDEQLPALQRTTYDPKEPLSFRVYGQLVRLMGRGSDKFAYTDAMLAIDFGGDDVYEGRPGAGVRYAAVLIDLGGNDRYQGRDLSVGTGVLGIGIARDLSGDDTYAGNNLSCGVGMAGVGLLIDSAGDDVYRAKTLAQGFGMFGVGLLVDASGDDLYQLGLMGQGAARTSGVGMLIDRKGDDTYRAGGIIVNSPLFEDVTYSFAQGYASGYREDTGGISGGIGMLTDMEGRDAYMSETYAQGASYWLSIGSLLDGAGHDSYSGYHYVQSSAMHLCAAYLMDLAGDDSYSTKFGASHAIGHDYGVAMLLDRAGNDLYFAQDSIPGIGNANGIGLFIEGAGNDRYQGPPGRGNAARGSGSVGLFVDGDGQDVYRDGLADGQVRRPDAWSLGYDLASSKIDAGPSERTAPRPLPGSLPVPNTAEMEQLYRRATQWSVGTAQAQVEEALSKLVGVGLPAVQWMLDKKLTTSDRLQNRAFVHVIRDVGVEAQRLLGAKIASGNLNEKRNGLAIAVDGNFREAAGVVPGLMSVPELQNNAVRAAGVLGANEAVPSLMRLAANRSQLGLSALISLAQIGDERAFTTAESLLITGSLPVRQAAIDLMVKFPLRATATGQRLLLEKEERSVRIGVELLGRVGTPEALAEVGTRLLAPSPGVRAQAILALQGQCPEDLRLRFLSMRMDPDAMVRAVAMRADPGR